MKIENSFLDWWLSFRNKPARWSIVSTPINDGPYTGRLAYTHININGEPALSGWTTIEEARQIRDESKAFWKDIAENGFPPDPKFTFVEN